LIFKSASGTRSFFVEATLKGMEPNTGSGQRKKKPTGKHHVHVVLHAEPQVVLVLLGESGQIDIGVREVDTLSRGDEPVVTSPDLDGFVVCDLEHVEGQNTIINVDDAAGLDNLGDVLVVDIPATC
jgi:hypothetical protein